MTYRLIDDLAALSDPAGDLGTVRYDDGAVRHDVIMVDLDAISSASDEEIAAAGATLSVTAGVSIGVTSGAAAVPSELLEAVSLTYGPPETDDRRVVGAADPRAAADARFASVRRNPAASAVLDQLLRACASMTVADALRMESAAYSMLLAGDEFRHWLDIQPVRTPRIARHEFVTVSREGDVLHVTLDEPSRRNPFSARMRDQLCDALAVALADPAVHVLLDGAGANFCSGGDLAEFGSTPDPVSAHVIRVERSVGARLSRLADRSTVRVHGACVGAGVELPAFAGHVVADRATTFRLPEIAMGLIPGAGGTVSLARRIGRWRLSHLALAGDAISAEQALRWGIIDEIGDRPSAEDTW